jgi:outer membrane protein
MKSLVVALALSAALAVGPASTWAQVPAPAPQKPAPAAAAPAAAPQKSFPEGFKIAYINPQRILAESVLGKASTTRLSALRAQKLAELTAKNKELDAAQQKLASASMVSQEASVAAQRSVDRIQVDIQRLQQDAEAALQELQQQLNVEFDRALAPIVAQVASEKSLVLLLRLDTGSIAWADPVIDLTADVIKRLDAAKAAAPIK